ncbi:sulfite exporter TauE/SafE family protein [Endozoicomonas sp. SCSIO W0465]|uniref:sulfite exporter TauE/SafE family protein n=1 Tax=Endozoicomonas sp. SCSIO W0465 TaxID=2918516 RepID=UPI0020756339|nr:sulfite exporter TauE/SafE family protein [Endozoicomonas sp. SCSIO W0465]USE34617.1 sulfite exporter TauE/SafE family protein [Endozoicomonas sp. SCSIO W0465]
MALSISELSFTLLIGCLIGLALGMTGVGGGVLMIPILRGVFGMNPVLAVGTASLCAFLMKINAAAIHIRMGNISWRKSGLMLAGAIPATFLTTQYIVRLSQNPETASFINGTVDLMVIAAIVLSLVSMVYKDLKDLKSRKKPEVTVAETTEEMIPMGNIAPWRPLLAGVGSGVVIGATGVGGGVLLLPILTVLLQVNIKQAVGSSIVIALLLSGLSALNYADGGQADMTTAIVLIAGSMIGVPIAGKLVKVLSDTLLHRITLGLIAVSALMMLSSSLA